MSKRVTVLSMILLSASLYASQALADHAPNHSCRFNPIGYLECHWTGERVERIVTPAPTPPPPPGGPYLRTGVDRILGPCWFWASRPPGLDSSDPRNEDAITAIAGPLPPCEGEAVLAQAWEVFRRFPLAGPLVTLEPPTGITGLPTYLSTDHPAPIRWAGMLPSGVRAEVEAGVTKVEVAWGDGTTDTYPLEALRPYPEGSATHLYRLKTCSDDYRAGHPSGPNCHPFLSAYPVRVTFTWFGRFRTGGGWIGLGTLDRTTASDYDVDEVVGVLEDD